MRKHGKANKAQSTKEITQDSKLVESRSRLDIHNRDVENGHRIGPSRVFTRTGGHSDTVPRISPPASRDQPLRGGHEFRGPLECPS